MEARYTGPEFGNNGFQKEADKVKRGSRSLWNAKADEAAWRPFTR